MTELKIPSQYLMFISRQLQLFLSAAYDCPYNDDILCNSNCYRAHQFCHRGQRCSDVNLNCSKLSIVLFISTGLVSSYI